MRTPRLDLPKEIYALFFVRLVVSAGNFVSPFLAMLLTMKLGYGERDAGLFMSAVSLASAGGLLIGGKLGDHFPRRRVLSVIQILAAMAYLSCAAAGFRHLTPFIMAAAMVILSGSWPVMNAIVADRSPPDRLKESFALLYWGNNIGFSLGPLVAGFLFASAPRLLFAGNAAVLLLAAGIVLRFVTTVPEALLARSSSGGKRDHDCAEVADDAACGESTLSVLWRNPTLLLFAPLSALTAFVYNQHTFALPLFLGDLLGSVSGPKAFGVAMTVNGLTVVLCTAAVTALSRRVPSLLAIAGASVLYAVGFGSYALATGLPLVLASTAVWTLGEILGATNINAFIAERAPPSHRGRINGALSFFNLAGSAAAPLAAGALVAMLGSRAVWFPVAVLAAIGAAGGLALYVFDRLRPLRSSSDGCILKP